MGTDNTTLKTLQCVGLLPSWMAFLEASFSMYKELGDNQQSHLT